MADSPLSRKTQPAEQADRKEEYSLKGTLISVGVVGAIILIMWAGVFWLYMSRV
ncbi:cytochrome c oxidase subunit 2A [Salibacterium aidingense]|uniref:cytochrome c oxidase subunit 2A n=1 Tax=Salibacterium aidingense TaxID=384933 RepID=UPI00041D864D|nr:cytochrome c oxidase subunit 2A [Salibacterium aidingense]